MCFIWIMISVGVFENGSKLICGGGVLVIMLS